MDQPTLTRPLAPKASARARAWIAGLVALVAAVALVVRLDLAPRVEADFFFATDDPQMQSSAAVDALFPSRPQILLQAAGDPGDAAYVEAVGALTGELESTPGVKRVYSLTSGPSSPSLVAGSPLWRRLLLPGGEKGAGSLLIAEIGEAEPAPETRSEESASLPSPVPDTGVVVGLVEGLAARFAAPGSAIEDLEISGVPYVVERVRRRLLEDLQTFSLTSLLLFGLAVAVIFRSWPVVGGTLATCALTCAASLGALRLLGVPIGLLTANLATIVFVLTLSHVIFLTAAFRRAGGVGAAAVTRAVRETFPASFWCMTTTLLGFSSLLFTSARPMRELGTAGAVGTVLAMIAAFALYPIFLRASHLAPGARGSRLVERLPQASGRAVALLAALTLFAAFGLPRLDTDPSLLSYFARGGELRRGLEAVDAAGGSSPLSLVVVDGDGEAFDRPVAAQRLAAAQAALEADPAVGTALSLAVVLEEARRVPLASFLGLPQLLSLLSSPAYDGVARSFVTEDRQQALLLLRMRETAERGSRLEVVDRLLETVRGAGLEPRLVGGLYALQGQLSALVTRSLLLGLGALTALFLIIAAVVARELRTAAAMVLCLLALPVLILGTLGWLERPLDVIASPSANVALALGIDSMIHLVVRRRRLRAEGLGAAESWTAARHQMALPILGAALVIGAGFGIFGLSSFPPTRNFGLAVVVGTLAAAALALLVLPWLADGRIIFRHRELHTRDGSGA